MIIAQLCQNNNTLYQCTLVCRDWLPASRHHLFHYIVIHYDRQLDLLVSRIVRSDERRPWLLPTRTLSLHGWTSELKCGQNGRVIQGLPLLELAGHAARLECIDLRFLDWAVAGFCPHPRTLAALHAFASVHTMRLYHCNLPSFDVFRRIVTALPKLSTLDWTKVEWPEAKSEMELVLLARNFSKGFSSPALSSLVFGGHYHNKASIKSLQILLRWLSLTPSRSTLRTVKLCTPNLTKLLLWDFRHLSVHKLVVCLSAFQETLDKDYFSESHNHALLHAAV